MFRRYFLPVLAGIAFIFSTSLLAAAQNGQLRGVVTLKQADGTTVPAANAVVDVFRWDLPGDFNLKTNKSGEFVHAGLPIQGTYVISVSMPGAQPYYYPNIRLLSDEPLKIQLSPGDGRRLTRADLKTLLAKNSAAGSASGGTEDKAKTEELKRKNAEIEEANKKVEASNETINRTFKAGNDALRAKNYDLAISTYDEGIATDPDHPGIASLLTNKTLALTARGVDRFNSAIRSTDDATKTSGVDAAKKDWTSATESSAKAVQMLKALTPPTDPAAANAAKLNLYFALLARAEAMRMFVSKVDQSKVDEGIAAYDEYIAAETDPAKKATAQHSMAQMLFDANAFDKALVQYQKILEANPDDLDALLHSGMALFNTGAINSDKAKYQEAANYLARYVEKAPDTDSNKADAKAILDNLKDQANVKPEKTSTPVRRTTRPH